MAAQSPASRHGVNLTELAHAGIHFCAVAFSFCPVEILLPTFFFKFLVIRFNFTLVLSLGQIYLDRGQWSSRLEVDCGSFQQINFSLFDSGLKDPTLPRLPMASRVRVWRNLWFSAKRGEAGLFRRIVSLLWLSGKVQRLPRWIALSWRHTRFNLSHPLGVLRQKAWHRLWNLIFVFIKDHRWLLTRPLWEAKLALASNGQVLVSGGRSTWCTKNLPPTPHCCLQMAHFCERSATFSSKLYSSKCIRFHKKLFYLGKSMKQRDSNWFLMERQLTTKDQLRQISSQRFNKV